LPRNYLTEIQEYQCKGYRVLAYATKNLDVKLANNLNKVIHLDREQVETENTFTFLGIVVMENQLKSNSKEVINELNHSDIRSIIATGDNIFTAISVAKKCGIFKSSSRIVFSSEIDYDNEVQWCIEQAEERCSGDMEHPPGAGDAAGREEVDIEIHCPGIETVEEEDSGVLDETFFNEQSGSQVRTF